jgi:hypothetical protein
MTISHERMLSMLGLTLTLPVGADNTGVADSTAALQAAIDIAQANNGGDVLIPPGTYKIGTSGTGLVINTSNVRLIGAGESSLVDSGATDVPAVTLVWGGSANPAAVMISVSSPAGASNNRQSCIQVANIRLNCNSLAGFGLVATSVIRCRFANLYVMNPNQGAAFQTTTLANGQLISAVDCQHNIFQSCIYRCIDSSNAIQSHGFWLTNANPTSATNGNSSFNTFIDCWGETDGLTANSSGVGIKVDAGDNNTFLNCITYRNAGTTTPGVTLNGYSLNCDGNHFIHFSDTQATNAINILGNASLSSGFNPVQNSFYMTDEVNSIAYPTMDAGCRCFWLDSLGVSTKPIHLSVVIGQASNETNALAQVANLTSESARIYNASQNHIQLTDGTHAWGLNIDGSGNLRMSSLTGGSGITTGGALSLSGAVGMFGVAVPSSQITGYGTPTGGSRAALTPGTATLTQVCTLLNQLILDLKTFGPIGT